MSRLSSKEINRIIELRKKGLSLPEIKKEVSRGYGTIYKIVSSVEIPPVYKKEWLGKRGGSIKRKKQKEENAIFEARKIITHLTVKEKMIFLSALYWGEGNKKDFSLSNTDPDLIKVFVSGLREIFKISNERLRISIRIYEDLDKARCLEFWSKLIGIPVENFVNVNILKGKKIGKLKYGMCRVRVLKGGDLLKYLLALKQETINQFYPRSSTDRAEVS